MFIQPADRIRSQDEADHNAIHRKSLLEVMNKGNRAPIPFRMVGLPHSASSRRAVARRYGLPWGRTTAGA